MKITFKDCNNKIIQELKGSTDDKDFETGYPDALKNATKMLTISNPKTTTSLEINKETTPDARISANVNTTPIATSQEKALNFTNGQLSYQLIKLGPNQLILVSSQSSTPFAKLTESSKPGIFHVVLDNNQKTLAYTENGNIVIEFPQSDGSFSKQIFLKK